MKAGVDRTENNTLQNFAGDEESRRLPSLNVLVVATYEDYVGLRGLEEWGKKKWRCHVADVVARLIAALQPTT